MTILTFSLYVLMNQLCNFTIITDIHRLKIWFAYYFGFNDDDFSCFTFSTHIEVWQLYKLYSLQFTFDYRTKLVILTLSGDQRG